MKSGSGECLSQRACSAAGPCLRCLLAGARERMPLCACTLYIRPRGEQRVWGVEGGERMCSLHATPCRD